MAGQAAIALGLHRDEVAYLGEIFECAYERRADKKFDPAALPTLGQPRPAPPTKEERRDRAGQLPQQAMALLTEVAKEEQQAE